MASGDYSDCSPKSLNCNSTHKKKVIGCGERPSCFTGQSLLVAFCANPPPAANSREFASALSQACALASEALIPKRKKLERQIWH